MEKHTKKSRFLSWVLRHAPDKVGLQLDRAGWANVLELIDCASQHGVQLTESVILDIVQSDSKGRYGLSADGARVRALYGHSVSVDLELRAEEPPNVLYHGTARRFLEAILEGGLNPGGRQYVHLSTSLEDAVTVGRRHGQPIVLEVKSQEMCARGHLFYPTGKSTWLVRSVPREFLCVRDTAT